MSACARFPRRFRRSSLLVGATAALTLVAAPAIAHEDPNADAPVETTYTVQEGEFLAEIAQEHDLDGWAPIYALNHDAIDHPDVLRIGQELDIPAEPDAVDVDAIDIPGQGAPAGSADRSQASSDGQATSQGTQESTSASPEPQPSQSASGSVWDRLAQCESNGNWSTNTGNGFYGGLQFHPQTWAAHGGNQYAPNAHLASRGQEIAIAERVLASQGWSAWPACSSKMGLR